MLEFLESALRMAFVFACAVISVPAQTPPAPLSLTADAIMARVAANQDQAEEARSHFVYVQHAKVVSRKGSALMCEEITDYRVTPSPGGSTYQLLTLDGRLLAKHKYLPYHALADSKEDPKTKQDEDATEIDLGDDPMDRDLVENMRRNLMNDKSRDGINARLFPLTSKAQNDYAYHMVGREKLNGRDVFHITFRPKDRSEFTWKGDAYIDSAAFQPVLVTTAMARKIPFAVRTLLGTNVPGLGFTVVYAPQADGVWFPVSFSTEFKFHVLYFFHRQIMIDAQNRDFEKTHVSSKIVGDAIPAEDPKP